MVKEAGGSEDAQVAAVLHDVVEDTKYTIEDIIRELPFNWPPPGWHDGQHPSICRMVTALTKKDGQDKVQAVEQLFNDWVPPEAMLIKMADRIDNLRPDADGSFGPRWMKKQVPSTRRLLYLAESVYSDNVLFKRLLQRLVEIEELVVPEPRPVVEGTTRPAVEGDD